LAALCEALTHLASHRRALIQDAVSRGGTTIPPLKVRICLSSRSILQKLLHPQSRNGYVYPPSAWPKKLGLPEPALLETGGIQLQVKSLFFLPFSVMHPKFVIIDRRRAFVPSCNISWEAWLEGCVEITGEAVQALLSFYSRTWENADDMRPPLGAGTGEPGETPVVDITQAGHTLVPSTAHFRTAFQAQPGLPTLVLPSAWHRNPRFRPLPWQKPALPPGTPLNIALLQAFERAERSIFIQTPNITCETAIAALLDALARGVDVTIVTYSNMMVLEQLVTAGTTTSWCIRSLIRRFCGLKGAPPGRHVRDGAGTETHRDLEAARSVGHLRISYFRAKSWAGFKGRETRPLMPTPPQGEEPVHSHFKLALVDCEFAMFGSGNMDRASWYTSQELGILFYGREFCTRVKAGVDGVLEGRLEMVFDSDERRD
jgi:phosphatidylserine/phosphatidylglycerophosphate/cardiolipin synthase-like enzyme